MRGQLLPHLTDDSGEAPRGSAAPQGELGPGPAVSAGAHALVTRASPGHEELRWTSCAGQWCVAPADHEQYWRRGDMLPRGKGHPDISTGGGRVPGSEEERGGGAHSKTPGCPSPDFSLRD